MAALAPISNVAAGGFHRSYQLARRMLSSELARVSARLDSAGALPGPGGVAVRQMTSRPGKMLRPMLVGLLHRALGGAGGPLSGCAASVVEFLHVATLLHDDVVDESPLRRGVPTGAAVAGNAAAVLGGDAMVVLALREAQKLGGTALHDALTALDRLVRGELIQLANRRQVSIRPDEALEVCALKTGSLMRLCAQLAAAGADHPPSLELVDGLEKLGIAFQLTDNLLDLTGNPALLGKSVGADIRQGTLSFPVALALHQSPLHAQKLAAAFQENAGDDVLGDLVGGALAGTTALADTHAVATEHLRQPAQAIAELPASRARTLLLSLCTTLSQRSA